MAEDAERTEQQPEAQAGAQPEEQAAPQENDGKGAGDTAQEAGAADEAQGQADLAAAVEEARKQAAEHFDRWARLQAEFENYKRRMHKEQTEMLKYAQLPLLKDLTGVVDNLERAIAHGRTSNHPETKSFVEGLDMVTKQVGEVFERFGMTRIAAIGEPFDPNKHEAMKVVETEEFPEDTVVEEFRTGYALHDRIVRPTMVVVSKKPQAPSGDEAPGNGSGDTTGETSGGDAAQ